MVQVLASGAGLIPCHNEKHDVASDGVCEGVAITDLDNYHGLLDLRGFLLDDSLLLRGLFLNLELLIILRKVREILLKVVLQVLEFVEVLQAPACGCSAQCKARHGRLGGQPCRCIWTFTMLASSANKDAGSGRGGPSHQMRLPQ